MKNALEKAPEHIRSLVDEKPCRDYFRFGNGGVLESLMDSCPGAEPSGPPLVGGDPMCFTGLLAWEGLLRELRGDFGLSLQEGATEVCQ